MYFWVGSEDLGWGFITCVSDFLLTYIYLLLYATTNAFSSQAGKALSE